MRRIDGADKIFDVIHFLVLELQIERTLEGLDLVDIIRIVAEAIAEDKHPEGKDALELQNRLIGEAIKIHNLQTRKK